MFFEDHVICALHRDLHGWFAGARCDCVVFALHGARGGFLAIWGGFGRFRVGLVIGAICEVRLHRVTRGHAWWCMVIVLNVFGDFCILHGVCT